MPEQDPTMQLEQPPIAYLNEPQTFEPQVASQQHERFNAAHNTFRRIGAVAGATLAFAGAAMAQRAEGPLGTESAHAAKTEPVAINAKRLYAADTPNHNLTALPEVLFYRDNLSVREKIKIKSVSLSPSTVVVEGDCAQKSLYSLWADKPESLTVAMCDNSSTVTSPKGSRPDSSRAHEKELNELSRTFANTIPGIMINPRQSVKSFEASPTRTKITLTCPPRSQKPGMPNYKTVEVDQANRLKVDLCPTNNIFKFTTLDVSDPTFKKAITKFRNDPYRKPNAGSTWERNTFFYCPDNTARQVINVGFKYNNSKKNVNTQFDSSYSGGYCDAVGTNTEQVNVEIKKPGSKTFKRVGKTVIHVNTLANVLGSYDYGYNTRRVKPRVTINNVNDICAPGPRKTEMRIRLTARFNANKYQAFQPSVNGTIKVLRDKKANYFSPVKKIC